MIHEISKIAHFIIDAFLHIWPYLLVTIPIAVAVNMSGASTHIKRVFDAGPKTAIILATLVGAFSPFCSCGVIPVIAALLIGGVPLPPVMSFWIASPSMDPEIFFLSVGTIGFDLAVWRLAGTLVISLAAGFITYYFTRSGWIKPEILKPGAALGQGEPPATKPALKERFRTVISGWFAFRKPGLAPVNAAACCAGDMSPAAPAPAVSGTGVSIMPAPSESSASSGDCGCENEDSFAARLARESLSATLMVIRFMALAFFLEALIVLYVPETWITATMGRTNSWAIFTAALLGVPVYTSSLSALPMVSGLLSQGMSPAAALAFLIAGPTTTLPAMAAVWTLVRPRIFVLYVSFALLGAVILGYLKLLTG
ncbi:MAG: hypothetical protein D3926_03745 [Desulfobacteraceae bacterium]|nr:MAG: hypothetical protein D3926_03745 [Desulfobacteraceae bacterium]